MNPCCVRNKTPISDNPPRIPPLFSHYPVTIWSQLSDSTSKAASGSTKHSGILWLIKRTPPLLKPALKRLFAGAFAGGPRRTNAPVRHLNSFCNNRAPIADPDPIEALHRMPGRQPHGLQPQEMCEPSLQFAETLHRIVGVF